MKWFGDPWPPELMPIGAPEDWVATPVEHLCGLCREQVGRLDAGHIGVDVDGWPAPRHIECEFVATIAGRDHAENGHCVICDQRLLGTYHVSPRTQARLIWAHYLQGHQQDGSTRPEGRGRHRN